MKKSVMHLIVDVSVLTRSWEVGMLKRRRQVERTRQDEV